MLCAWLAILGLVVASAVAFSGQTNSKFSVPGTESQQAQDLLQAMRLIFPEAVILVREAREGFGT